MRFPKLVLAVILGVFLLQAGNVWSDWDPGDSHKMHFPQLPDTNGLDVKFRYRLVLADDWLCSEAGGVTDIHFWFSCFSDYTPDISLIHASIHEDIPSSPPEILYSRPGALLWSRNFGPDDVTIREYARGTQGWYNPKADTLIPDDHEIMYQCNIENISDPFVQEPGTIYWLDLSIISEYPLGWKTSLDTFNDNAVWGEYSVPGPTCLDWEELIYPDEDPRAGQGMDLAFVITDHTWLDDIYGSHNQNEIEFQAAGDIQPNTTVQLHAVTPAGGVLYKKVTSAPIEVVWSRLDIQIGSIDEKGFAPITVIGGGGQFAPYLWRDIPVGPSDFGFLSGSGQIHWPSGDINLQTVINISTAGFADIRANATGLGSIDYNTDVVTLFAGSSATGITIVPTLTTWGIIFAVLFLIVAGTVVFVWRRRRALAN